MMSADMDIEYKIARFKVQLAEAVRNSVKKIEQHIFWLKLGNNFWKEMT